MSTKCPLCGNSKSDDSLFCPDCTEKLNNEYEVDVPTSENRADANSNESSESKIEPFGEEKLEESSQSATEQIGVGVAQEITNKPPIDARRKKVAAPNFDKRAWRRQKEDKRSHSNKSYYQLSKEKKSGKVIAIIFLIVVLVGVLVGGLYLYNDSVKGGNLDRSAWEVAQRENTVDSYLDYMALYPQGEYSSEAYSSMLKLKEIEAGEFENLLTSENTSEFTAFLEKYTYSPYARIVKARFDSLMWQSSLHENSVDAYSDYINRANSEEITGDYIGEAKKRFEMLNQSTPIDGGDLELIKSAVDGFFLGISTKSHAELSEHLVPVVVRYNNQTNLSSKQMIGQLLLQAAKEGAESLRLEAEVSNLKYEKMDNGTFEVNVPLQKIFENNDGVINQIKGYIVHLKLSPAFKVYSYHETKPYTEAP